MTCLAEETKECPASVSMDDDFSLFDPLQPTVSAQITEPNKPSTKVEGSKEKTVDKSVVLEDLLGGLNEEIKVDEVDGDGSDGGANGDRIRSTTSFFLLDFDNDGGGGAEPVVTDMTNDHKVKSIDDIIDGEDDDHLSVGSEVLSVNGDNLPLDQEHETGQEPQSGFFFHDLLESDQPRNAAKPQQSDTPVIQPVNTEQQNTPNFLIGSEVLVGDNKVVSSDLTDCAEDNLESLLDVEIPQEPAGSTQVSVPRQESFVTEVEEFTVVDDDEGDDITEPCESPAEIMDTTDSDNILSIDPQLEAQLRPVFDMCGPDSRGRISIEHLEKMCRENGQVSEKSYFLNYLILYFTKNKLFCVCVNLCLCFKLWVCIDDNNSVFVI